jgi:hypothetical protein
MDYISVLHDSVSTSVSMNLFNSREISSYAHIFKSKLIKFPLNKCKFNLLGNFNSHRLQKTAIEAYPLNDRPRGDADIKSVKYYQKCLQNNKNIQPIWILKKNNQYILLDGAHRIVASYIEKKIYIDAYLIKD